MFAELGGVTFLRSLTKTKRKAFENIKAKVINFRATGSLHDH
jgi:hypothetical protein